MGGLMGGKGSNVTTEAEIEVIHFKDEERDHKPRNTGSH